MVSLNLSEVQNFGYTQGSYHAASVLVNGDTHDTTVITPPGV